MLCCSISADEIHPGAKNVSGADLTAIVFFSEIGFTSKLFKFAILNSFWK